MKKIRLFEVLEGDYKGEILTFLDDAINPDLIWLLWPEEDTTALFDKKSVREVVPNIPVDIENNQLFKGDVVVVAHSMRGWVRQRKCMVTGMITEKKDGTKRVNPQVEFTELDDLDADTDWAFKMSFNTTPYMTLKLEDAKEESDESV